MKKVLVLISTPLADTPFHTWLKGEGIELFIFTTDVVSQQYQAIFKNVNVYSNYEVNSNVELDAIQIGRKIGFDAVYSRAEIDVNRAARIRKELGIPGLLPADTVFFRNKFAMKNLVHQHSIDSPNYAYCDEVVQIYNFIEKEGYPAVLKPLDGSGSTGVEVVRNYDELRNYLAKRDIPSSPILIEGFVNGAMYHADCLVVDHDLKLTCISRYINDCLNYKYANTFIGSVVLDNNNPLLKEMTDFSKKIINSFPKFKNGVYHLEFWQTLEGTFVFCEIACRPCGGRVPQQIYAAFGINIDQEYFLAECGIPSDTDWLSKSKSRQVTAGHLTIYPKKGKLLGLPEALRSDPRVKEYRVLGQVGNQYSGGEKSGRGIASLVIQGHEEKEVEEQIFKEYELFDSGCRWE